MPRDVQGNTQPLPGTIVSTGDTILPSQHNPMVNDVYAMLTQSLSRDGQGGMRSPLDMSGFRIFNVGPATAPTDAVSLSQFQTGTPIGTVVDFAGSSAPATWLLCFGQAVSRTTYAPLFAVIGTTFGAGDGSTTFNLPDARGRVSAGKDDMGGTASSRLTTVSGVNGSVLGSAGGTQYVTLDITQMPSHDHGGTTALDGSHTHTYLQQTLVGSNINTGGAIIASGGRSTEVTGGTGVHQHVINAQGGSQGHPNVQPTLVFNKIIKVSF